MASRSPEASRLDNSREKQLLSEADIRRLIDAAWADRSQARLGW